MKHVGKTDAEAIRRGGEKRGRQGRGAQERREKLLNKEFNKELLNLMSLLITLQLKSGPSQVPGLVQIYLIYQGPGSPGTGGVWKEGENIRKSFLISWL